MVSHDTEELNQEGDDIPLIEGFQWEMLLDAPSIPRKRCLSESSIAPDCSSFGRALFSTQTPGERSTREGLCRPGRGSSELEGSSPPNPISVYGNGDNLQQQDEERGQGQCEPKGQKQPDGTSKRTEKTLQREESVLGDSSSGTELYDVSGTGKKRRAAGVSGSRSGGGLFFVFLHGSVKNLCCNTDCLSLCISLRTFQTPKFLVWGERIKEGK